MQGVAAKKAIVATIEDIRIEQLHVFWNDGDMGAIFVHRAMRLCSEPDVTPMCEMDRFYLKWNETIVYGVNNNILVHSTDIDR
jgi:hypothetical protein